MSQNKVADAVVLLWLCQTSIRRCSTVLLGTAAVREMAEEHRLRYGGYTDPVGTAQTSIRLGHFFVADQLLSLGRLLTMDPPAIYAPFVVTRSLLDAAGWIHWLAEPDIGSEGQVKRRLLLDVLEAAEQRPPDRPEFREKRAQLRRVPQDVKAFCDQHGWSAAVGRKPDIGGERRPSRAQLVGAVVDRLGSDPSRGLGAMMWWKLSGSTHGSFDELIGTVEGASDLDPARGNAWIVSDGKVLIWLTHVAAEAVGRVTARRTQLFGDVDCSVTDASAELSRQRIRYVEAALKDKWPD